MKEYLEMLDNPLVAKIDKVPILVAALKELLERVQALEPGNK